MPSKFAPPSLLNQIDVLGASTSSKILYVTSNPCRLVLHTTIAKTPLFNNIVYSPFDFLFLNKQGKIAKQQKLFHGFHCYMIKTRLKFVFLVLYSHTLVDLHLRLIWHSP